MDKIKEILILLGKKVTGLYEKAVPALRSAGTKTADFLRQPKNAVICGGAVLVIAAACVFTWLAVNVWSWAEVTVTMPRDLMVTDSDIVSAADVSASDLVSGADVLSDSDVSASDAESDTLPVSGADVSFTDLVSGADVLSGSDASSEEAPLTTVCRIKKGSTVADVLAQLGITLDESLSIDTPADTVVEDDMAVTIYRMMQVTVNVDGGRQTGWTEQETVALMLEEQGIVLGEHDRMSVSASDLVENGMEITINRVTVVDEVKAEPVPFSTERRENASVLEGKTSVLTAGVDGSKNVTYRCVYVDGILESSQAIAEVVTLEPVTEVVEYGTKRTTTTTTRRTNAGKYVVSKEKVYDCDGSGHGYYIITYSDGSVVYQDF